ncbi:MAG: hypothetical protein ABW148_01415 [Sedimenticola sp.]
MVAIYEEALDLLSSNTKNLLKDNLDCMSYVNHFGSMKCNYTLKQDPLLAYFHQRNYGAKGTFVGLYFVDNDAWVLIEKSINKDKLAKLNKNQQLTRYESMENINDVKNLIDSTFPNNGLIVKPLSISATEPPNIKKEKKLFQIFEECFRGSESKLHGYFKWFSYCHLSKMDPSCFNEPLWSSGIGFEVKYSLPGNRLLRLYTKGRGSIVRPEHDHQWDWTSCIQKIADVYSAADRVIVECGATNSMSLVAPIKAKVARRVIWIPYPIDFNENTEICDFNFKCNAYIIHARQPVQLRKSHARDRKGVNEPPALPAMESEAKAVRPW